MQLSQAIAAEAQVRQLKLVANQIESLRRAPVRVEQGVRTGEALARIIETSAKKAGLSPELIVRIDPGDVRQLGDSPFFEQRTDVELREAPLQKVIEFAIAVENAGTSMEVPNLSLRLPGGLEDTTLTDELWNAQLLLTSRIYQPKISAPLSHQKR